MGSLPRLLPPLQSSLVPFPALPGPGRSRRCCPQRLGSPSPLSPYLLPAAGGAVALAVAALRFGSRLQALPSLTAAAAAAPGGHRQGWAGGGRPCCRQLQVAFISFWIAWALCKSRFKEASLLHQHLHVHTHGLILCTNKCLSSTSALRWSAQGSRLDDPHQPPN